MNIGFDNEKYLQMQSAHIRERIAQSTTNFTWNLAANYLMTFTHPVYFRDPARTPRCVC